MINMYENAMTVYAGEPLTWTRTLALPWTPPGTATPYV